ncbi:MAG: CRISPR-associated protein Cas4 [Spirosomaceae bacterium]|nr:CRISPR-associated protein Cas4 [Spirosomataceae bacterium]
MTINATLINYLHLCHRKMWLHYHAIRMEHTSEVVAEGKLIGEESYPQRADKNQEVEVTSPWRRTSPPAPLQVERGETATPPAPLLYNERGSMDNVVLTAKIDFFDAKNGVVYETKKSAAKEWAHVAQVQFYLYLLRKNGVEASHGIIEYPKLRQTERVTLDSEEEAKVEEWIEKAVAILENENCPPKLPISKCKSCSYFDFCWVGED